MIMHIVIFSWIPGTKANQVDEVSRAIDRLAGDLSDTVSITHGPDLGFREGDGDYALVATFADRAGWDAYQADPRHKALLRDLVTPLLAARRAVQFQHAE